MNSEELINLAKRRVQFKEHVAIFLLANIVLWVINAIINYEVGLHFYWAALVTIGWGAKLSFHFTKAYLYNPDIAIKREYARLKKKKR